MDGPYHQMHSSSDDPDYTEFTQKVLRRRQTMTLMWSGPTRRRHRRRMIKRARRGRCRLGKKVPHAEEVSPMEEAPWE
jgi:hypothetical protein